MAKDDAVKSVARLMAAFSKDLAPETISVYADELGHVSTDVLAEAVSVLIRRAKFYPSIAEILDACVEVSGLGCSSADELLAIVRRADVRVPVLRRDGTPTGDEERLWEWPEMSSQDRDAIEAALQVAGEPCTESGKDIFGWEQGFRKAAESARRELGLLALKSLDRASLPGPEGQKMLPATPKRGDEPWRKAERLLPTDDRTEGTFSPASDSVGRFLDQLDRDRAGRGLPPVERDEQGYAKPS